MNEQKNNRSVSEAVWRLAESNMARRERFRYVRMGRIVPAHRMQPQLMVKDGGRWVPQLGGCIPPCS